MTVNPRQSFKLKLCLSILVASLLSFILIFSASLYYTSREIKDSVSTIVSSKLSLATRALNDKLSGIEIASDNLMALISSPLFDFDGDSANEIGKNYLNANPHIQGVCIGYEDGSVYGHKGPWCPYVMRQGNDFIVRDLSQTKDFRQSEWYRTPIDTRSKAWSKPFQESNGTIIVSYNVPIFNETSNEPVCVVAVDQNLNDLSDSLQALSPYVGSCLYLIDSEGRFLAHPDHDKVFAEALSTEQLESVKSGAEYLVDKVRGETVYLFPSTIGKTDWTVILSVPKSAMISRPKRMMNIILLDMLLGLLLLLAGSLYVISRLTEPLEDFAEAARKISHGDFNVNLPLIKDHNELYDLRSALVSMKDSLDEYTKELSETSAKKASIERELDIARNIQMAMIPKIFPPYPERKNVDIFASLKPAQAVGGDLYDFVLVGDKFFFCVGDVSGKGVPASLLMAITRTIFRNSVAVEMSPKDIASVLNNAISEGNEMGMFVTMMIGSFDFVTGELKLCNCGHNLPATNGKISDPATMKAEPFDSYHLIAGVPTNIAIGVVPGYDYKEISMNIVPGCSLLLYTDGVTEAENEAQEQYGDDRLLACLEANEKGANSKTLVENLLSDLNSFVGNAKQNDDITLLFLRCNHLG